MRIKTFDHRLPPRLIYRSHTDVIFSIISIRQLPVCKSVILIADRTSSKLKKFLIANYYYEDWLINNIEGREMIVL